ncbi:FecR family protein [Odoribacter sp. AF15-53]|uniref:FecR family protein n=1 Tax=Odoribacter sp. AF15-53 TaxID=2292236 RepID=UPI000E54A77E|nr:FecR family protein [Odoribacter sp. AF15-53]RHR82630.1 DUF4974 domain-containing protein [Odoribacter sp. AF15-53]
MRELPEDIVLLILKSSREGLSREEQVFLREWIQVHPECMEEVDKLKRYAGAGRIIGRFRQVDTDAAWCQVDRKTTRKSGWGRRRIFVPWLTAAAIIVPFVVGMVLFDRLSYKGKNLVVSELRVEPGSYKAVLKLPGGEQVVLHDKREQEIVTKQGNVVAKDSINTLVIQGNVAQVEVSMVQVPQGGEYRVILSDGTRVWINSGSELRFPTNFEGEERVVDLKGEAYFEVTKNVDHPFIVRTEKSAIRVLGTSFNVCSYTDDKFEQTTLVNGAVEVLYRDQLYRLKPGEQFEMQAGNECPEVKKVDVKLYMSWQEGIFRFQDMPLDELVLKLQRWYNVNFFFANESCRKYHFTGAIRKDIDFKEFIDLIELVTKVQFSVKENTIIISEK